MVNGYGYHLPDRIIKPAKIVQTLGRVYCFCGCAGIAAKRRKGARVSGGDLKAFHALKRRPSRQARPAPCCGKAAISKRGESSLCGDKPSAERTRPQGCISAPFVPKGFIRRSRFRLVFSDIPALVHSSRQAGEVLWLPRRSCSLLPAQCSQRPRPGR